eukprot:2933376-Pleurochrysis_carterae.AAC.1
MLVEWKCLHSIGRSPAGTFPQKWQKGSQAEAVAEVAARRRSSAAAKGRPRGSCRNGLSDHVVEVGRKGGVH